MPRHRVWGEAWMNIRISMRLANLQTHGNTWCETGRVGLLHAMQWRLYDAPCGCPLGPMVLNLASHEVEPDRVLAVERDVEALDLPDDDVLRPTKQVWPRPTGPAATVAWCTIAFPRWAQRWDTLAESVLSHGTLHQFQLPQLTSISAWSVPFPTISKLRTVPLGPSSVSLLKVSVRYPPAPRNLRAPSLYVTFCPASEGLKTRRWDKSRASDCRSDAS